jgi:peptidoglycan/LPS O-acetylase OafA/YrhL
MVPFNGHLAVMVFFIVSGWSLSMRYLVDGELRSWSNILIGRYLRLAIPVFTACLIVHFVMMFGWVSADRLPVFRPLFNFEPTVWHLLRFSLFDVFFNYKGTETYIGPLWTMSIELVGSFIVLFSILVVRPIRSRSLLLCALAALILAVAPSKTFAMLALFPMGAALADGYNRGLVDLIPAPAAAVLILFGCSIPMLLSNTVVAWGMLSAIPLTVGCIALRPVRDFLSGQVSKELGRLSFPLYLIHGPVICFIGEPLTRYTGDAFALKIAVQGGVILASFAAAWAFVPVNEFAIRASHRFATNVTGAFFGTLSAAER